MTVKRNKVTKVSPKQSYLRTVIYECDFVWHIIAKRRAVIEFVDLMPKINVTYLEILTKPCKTVHSKEWLCCCVQEKTCFDFIEFIGDIGSVTHEQHISKSYTLFFNVPIQNHTECKSILRTQNNHHLSERTTTISSCFIHYAHFVLWQQCCASMMENTVRKYKNEYLQIST